MRGTSLAEEMERNLKCSDESGVTNHAFFAGDLAEMVMCAARFLEGYRVSAGTESADSVYSSELAARMVQDLDIFTLFLHPDTMGMHPALFDKARADELVLITVEPDSVKKHTLLDHPDEAVRKAVPIAREVVQVLQDPDLRVSHGTSLLAAVEDLAVNSQLLNPELSGQRSIQLLQMMALLPPAFQENNHRFLLVMIEFNLAANERLSRYLRTHLPSLHRRSRVAQRELELLSNSVLGMDQVQSAVVSCIAEMVSGCRADFFQEVKKLPCKCETDIVDQSIQICAACLARVSTISRRVDSVVSKVPAISREQILDIVFYELNREIFTTSAQDLKMRKLMERVIHVLRVDKPLIPSKYVLPGVWSLAVRELREISDSRVPRDKLKGLNSFASILRNSMSLDPSPDALHDITALCMCAASATSVIPTIRYCYLAHLISRRLDNSQLTFSSYLEENGIVNVFLVVHYICSLEPPSSTDPQDFVVTFPFARSPPPRSTLA